jgi:hypothetical protein
MPDDQRPSPPITESATCPECSAITFALPGVGLPEVIVCAECLTRFTRGTDGKFYRLVNTTPNVSHSQQGTSGQLMMF